MRRCLNILSCLLLAAITASCMRIPLYDAEDDMNSNVEIDIDIDYNIENVAEPQKPEVMFVGFYDVETRKLLARDFTKAEGGPVNISQGSYDVLVYNFDTEYTIVSEIDGMETIKAATNRVPGDVARRFGNIKKAIAQHRATATNGEHSQTRFDYSDDPLINQPDHLFVGVAGQQDIPARDEENVFTVHVDASTLVETFRLEIPDITGLEYVGSMDAFITGQVEAITIGEYGPTGVPATIHVPLVTTSRGVGISTTFNTFGKYPPPEHASYVLLHITDTSGKEIVYEYEVTDQFNDKENNGRTIVVPIPIVIDPPSTQGSGLNPNVDLWDEENIDIRI